MKFEKTIEHLEAAREELDAANTENDTGLEFDSFSLLCLVNKLKAMDELR